MFFTHPQVCSTRSLVCANLLSRQGSLVSAVVSAGTENYLMCIYVFCCVVILSSQFVILFFCDYSHFVM